MDDIFMDEIIDSMGEDRGDDSPLLVKCFVCGELYFDDGETGCCIID